MKAQAKGLISAQNIFNAQKIVFACALVWDPAKWVQQNLEID